MENTGAVKARDQFRGCAAAAFVQYGIRYVGQIEVGGITEQQALQDRRHDQNDASGRVLEHCNEFLLAKISQAQQVVEKGQHRVQSSFLRVTKRASPSRTTA